MLMRSLQIDNPALAAFVKTKVLTIDKVMLWPQPALVDLIQNLQPNEVQDLERLAKTKRDWSDRVGAAILASKTTPSAPGGGGASNRWEQQSSANSPSKLSLDVVEISLIGRIRELERLGRLRLSDIDPARAA